MSWDICPVANLITQDYGCTPFQSEWLDNSCPHPPNLSGRRHTGIDFGTVTGAGLFRTPVVATRSGSVIAVGANVVSGYRVDPGFVKYLGPQAVCIRMADGRFIIYAHLDEAKVSVGQGVGVGTTVGLVGTKGNSTGPHLHVEVRIDGPYQSPFNTINPQPYLNRFGSGTETAGSEIRIQEEFDVTKGEKRGWAWLGFTHPLILNRVPASEKELDDVANVIQDDGGNVYDVLVSMYNRPDAKAQREKSGDYRALWEEARGKIASAIKELSA